MFPFSGASNYVLYVGQDTSITAASRQPGRLSDPFITGEIIVSAVWTHGKPGTHQWRGKGSEPGLEITKSSQFMMIRSNDDGKTWSKPKNWTEKLRQHTYNGQLHVRTSYVT